MKITLVIVAGIVVIFTLGFVAQGVIAQEEVLQQSNKPGMFDHEKLRNLQKAKGKAGKNECACTLNLDYDGVCENQPFFIWSSPKYNGGGPALYLRTVYKLVAW